MVFRKDKILTVGILLIVLGWGIFGMGIVGVLAVDDPRDITPDVIDLTPEEISQNAERSNPILENTLRGLDAQEAMSSPDTMNIENLGEVSEQEMVNNAIRLEAAKNKQGNIGLLEYLGLAFSYILYGIAYGLGWILILVTEVMMRIATYNEFIKQPAVTAGWTITRDICNNFFIIFMIVMAIGTTLNLQSYHWRNMLPKVLLMAVLINFSKLFVGIMIDASQVIMLTFAAPIASTTGYNIILKSFGLPNLYSIKGLAGNFTGSNGEPVFNDIQWLDIFAALFFAIIATIATLIVVSIIAIILVYRIVMLWFLIILSPLWIFAKAFNKLSEISGTWEGEIKKYLIVGPAMMFFLYLSFLTMSTTLDNLKNNPSDNPPNSLNIPRASDSQSYVMDQGVSDNLSNGGGSISDMVGFNGVINLLVVVGLLWGSLMMGQRFGGAASKWGGTGMNMMKKWTGANLATGLANKIGKKASGAVSSIAGAPKAIAGNIGTAVDDKLGLRAGLYRGVYGAVGGILPKSSRTALGEKIGKLDKGATARRQADISAAATATKVSTRNEDGLRSLSNKGGSAGIAATQELLRRGLISDSKHDNKDIALINKAREALKDTELGTQFDENLKKRNPNLALQTAYTNKSGRIDEAKLKEDIKTGKIDFADILSATNSGNLNQIKNLMGGDATGAMKFLQESFDGDSKKISSAIGKIDDDQIKKQLFAGIDANQIKDFATKDKIDAATGQVVRDAAGNKVKVADHKKLDSVISALLENEIDPGDIKNFYDITDSVSRKAYAKVTDKNIANLKNINENDIDDGNIAAAEARLKGIFDDVGDLLGKDAVEKLKSGSKKLKDAVDNSFNNSLVDRSTRLNSLPFGSADYNEQKSRLENFMERGINGGAMINLSHPSLASGTEANDIIMNKMAESSVDGLSNMKFKFDAPPAPGAPAPTAPTNQEKIAKNLWENMEPVALLNLFVKGTNTKLLKALREYIKSQHPTTPGTGHPNYSKYEIIKQYL